MLGLALLLVAHRTLRAIGVWRLSCVQRWPLLTGHMTSGIREIVVDSMGRTAVVSHLFESVLAAMMLS
jgi:hypothetical protein